jgi:hemerythrin-like domain-containing protein
MRRHAALRGLSSDHHHALVLAREARIAAEDPERAAAVWSSLAQTFALKLEPHFRTEERFLLPALEAAGEVAVVLQTRREHEFLRALVRGVECADPVTGMLLFADALERHVRFEEREVFEVAQRVLAANSLEALSDASQQARR